MQPWALLVAASLSGVEVLKQYGHWADIERCAYSCLHAHPFQLVLAQTLDSSRHVLPVHIAAHCSRCCSGHHAWHLQHPQLWRKASCPASANPARYDVQLARITRGKCYYKCCSGLLRTIAAAKHRRDHTMGPHPFEEMAEQSAEHAM